MSINTWSTALLTAEDYLGKIIGTFSLNSWKFATKIKTMTYAKGNLKMYTSLK
jgi:hypothetical protein